MGDKPEVTHHQYFEWDESMAEVVWLTQVHLEAARYRANLEAARYRATRPSRGHGGRDAC